MEYPQNTCCPNCGSTEIVRSGKSVNGEQRYRCKNASCSTQTFMLDYRYKAYQPGLKQKVIDMSINGCGVRSTARALGINKNTVMNTLKKKTSGGLREIRT